MKRVSVLLAILMLLTSTSLVFANWEDGTYEAWSDASDNSIDYAKVFIQDGEIAGVILREFTDKLIEKDYVSYPWQPYKTALKTQGAKYVEAQSADIDVTSGATGSSQGWNQAVERALLKADPKAKITTNYFDGVFLGRSETSDMGYYEVVWVTLKNDKIVDMKFQRIGVEENDYNVIRLEDYPWPLLSYARDEYRENAINAVPGMADAVTGATGSSAMWDNAVQDALDKARIK